MQKSDTTLLTAIIVAAFFVLHIAARCNVCNDNGIACVNETSFQLCFNGDRDTSQTFRCPGDSVCVSLGLRCVDREQGVSPACAISSTCGECDGLNMFTCTSRTTFVQCNGTEHLAGTEGQCPSGLTCDSQQAEICVNDCRAPENPECAD